MQIKDNGDIVLNRHDTEILIRLDENVKLMSIKIDKIDDRIKDYNGIKADVSWLKRFFWILATGVIGGLITSIFAVVIRIR